jgi:hypothetical protein
MILRAVFERVRGPLSILVRESRISAIEEQAVERYLQGQPLDESSLGQELGADVARRVADVVFASRLEVAQRPSVAEVLAASISRTDPTTMRATDWAAALSAGGVGDAASVADQLELAWAERSPERALRARLSPTSRAALAGAESVPLLTLDYSRQAGVLSLAAVEADTAEHVLGELRAHQRIFRVTGNVELASRLLSANLDTATRVAATSAQDLGTLLRTPLQVAEGIARRARAIEHDAHALIVATRQLAGRSTLGTPVDNQSQAALAEIESVPALRSLIDTRGACRCEQCRSIFGPAAYFVDLMAFVDEYVRSTHFPSIPPHPLDLRARRPDLWMLPLTCESTERLIPRLTTTLEVLRTYVAQALPTTTTVDQALSSASAGFGLPFSPGMTRTTALLASRGVDRAQFARHALAGGDSRLRLTLGTDAVGLDLITTPATTLSALAPHYGPALAGGLTSIDVAALLEPMSIQRDALETLLELPFVRGSGSTARVVPARSSPLVLHEDVEQLQGVDVSMLDRMHRVVRLARVAELSVAELGTALRILGATTLDPATMSRFADLRWLSAASGRPIESIANALDVLPADRASALSRLVAVPLEELSPLTHGALDTASLDEFVRGVELHRRARASGIDPRRAAWAASTTTTDELDVVAPVIEHCLADVAADLAGRDASSVLRARLASALSLEPSRLDALAVLLSVSFADPVLVAELESGAGGPALDALCRRLARGRIVLGAELYDAQVLAALAAAAGSTAWTVGDVLAFARVGALPADRSAALITVLQGYTTSGFAPANDAALGALLDVDAASAGALRGLVEPGEGAIRCLERLLDIAAYLDDRLTADVVVRLLSNTDATRDAAARELLHSAGGAHPSEAEQRVLEAERDALIDYIILQLRPAGLASRDDLYPYFLLDPEVGGCAETTRLSAGILSVQLYVHRILSNLERSAGTAPLRVQLTAEAAEEWAWRKSYRVWEANRRVFLYPESYLEPDLRDDKTPLFHELEQALLQKPIDSAAAFEAYATYLRGFEELASLEIVGAYHDVRRDRGSVTSDVLHLVGLTRTSPPVHYYRTVSSMITSTANETDRESWTSWRKLPFSIPVRPVSPVVYKEQLHLFWVEIVTRPGSKLIAGGMEFDGYSHTLALKYVSMRLDGSWTSPQKITLPTTVDGLEAATVTEAIDSNGTPVWATSPAEVGRHRAAVEGYTLTHESWTRAWVEAVWRQPPTLRRDDPDAVEREVLVISLRNYNIEATIDLGRMALVAARRPAMGGGPNSSFVIPSGLHIEGTRLLRRPARYPEAAIELEVESALANTRLTEASVALFGREFGVAARSQLLGPDTGVVVLGRFPDDADVSAMAVAGSPRNAIVHVDGDPLLIQSSTRSDGGYSVRRLGTRFAPALTVILRGGGLDQLLALATQRTLIEPSVGITPLSTSLEVSNPREPLGLDGPFGVYYREIFHDIPELIARALSAGQRYAESRAWYHYIFDPTSTDVVAVPSTATPAERERLERGRVWRYIEYRRDSAATPTPLVDIIEDDAAIAASRRDPLNPFAIARLRIAARQTSIVIQYIDNLIAWGDHLFRQFEAEPLAEAQLLYTLARDILGPRPRELGACQEASQRTYTDVRPLMDGVGDVVIAAVESLLPSRGGPTRSWVASGARVGSTTTTARTALDRHTAIAARRVTTWGAETAASPVSTAPHGLEVDPRLGGPSSRTVAASIVRQSVAVFCVPPNERLQKLWDQVEDRLYKLRSCRDLDGNVRRLAPFAPPIDPAALIRMKASGLTLGEILALRTAPAPLYRFAFLIERAKAAAAALSGLGHAFLGALERREGEELARLRLTHQQGIEDLGTEARTWELSSAEAMLESLQRQRDAAEHRRAFHDKLLRGGLSSGETAALAARATSRNLRLVENEFQLAASVVALVPQSGSPFAMKYGGVELRGQAAGLAGTADALAKGADLMAATWAETAGYARRSEAWKFAREQAERDLRGIDRQIRAAELRRDIARRAVEVHEASRRQTSDVVEFMDARFTNLGRYTWYAAELRRLFAAAYDNAMSWARLAEAAYALERTDARPLRASYWDDTHAGLLAGDRLVADLASLERRFVETNVRLLEVDQAISLAQVDPRELLRLRNTGSCTIDIPELMFDLYYPGQYRRRIRAVRVTVPAVTGAYTNVSARLTLLSSSIRTESTPTSPAVSVPAPRATSVATSTAQGDSGVFEFSFRDERYAPFEGAGAVSTWQLDLPRTYRPFDYHSINDVILSIAYTAEFSESLRAHVEDGTSSRIRAAFAAQPLRKLISLRQDYSAVFTRLLHAPLGTSVAFTIEDKHLPWFLRGRSVSSSAARLIVRTPRAPIPGAAPYGVGALALVVDGAPVQGFSSSPEFSDLQSASLPPAFGAALRGSHTISISHAGELAPSAPTPGDPSPLSSELLEDLLIYVELGS